MYRDNDEKMVNRDIPIRDNQLQETKLEAKQVMKGLVEINDEFYISKQDYDNVWTLYTNLIRKATIMSDKLEELGIDVDELLSKEGENE